MNLKHPHDLVILMRQETTVGYLKELEVTVPPVACRLLCLVSCLSPLRILSPQKHLVAQKIHIEENEDRDTGLEQRHYKDDPDCVLAKVPLGDMDLYDGTYMPLEDKNIRYRVHRCCSGRFVLLGGCRVVRYYSPSSRCVSYPLYIGDISRVIGRASV